MADRTRDSVRLEFDAFSFTYAERTVPALAEVSFSVRAGQLAVVSGRNGAGKSTMAMAANGTIPRLIRGTAGGSVRVNGRATRVPREMAREVGVVFQDFESHLVSSTVELEVAFPLENLGVESGEQRRRVADTLNLVGLSGFEERMPAELSGGEKQRLAIAAAVALEPSLLVLDEPLTDLDPLGKIQVLDVIARLRARGMTVLLVEHDPQALLAADLLLVLDAGRLVHAGPPVEVMADPARCVALGLPVWPPAEVKNALGIPGSEIGIAAVAAAVGKKFNVQRLKFNVEDRKETVTSSESLCGTSSPGVKRDVCGPTLGGPTSEIPLLAPLLEFRGVTSGYSGGPDILHDVSFSIRAGECVALLGQNGSGKTSLAKHAVGLIKLRAGEILIRGRSVCEYGLRDLSRVVGYVFQNPDHQIFSDTVLDEVAFGVNNLKLAADDSEVRIREAIDAVGLAGRESDDPFSLTKGERQRLAVASLLAYRPEAIFFDEPTTGLDAAEAGRMMNFIRELNGAGTTVILITHAMWAAAEYADRIIVLAHGRVVHDGTSREIFAREEALAELYLAPPPAAALANRLGIDALAVSELVEAIKKS